MYLNLLSILLVQGFKAGDEVYFAGSIGRHGCNAEYVATDYRLVAHKPKTVSHLVAASMPLTVLTAWEAIEEKFHISIPAPGSSAEKKNASKTLLIVAGAGGVGSIAIQLAKHVFKVGKVIATAGRPDSATWCRNMGADLVLDRTKDWKAQLDDASINGIDYILSCTEVDDILDTLVAISNPWGHICGIVSNNKTLNMLPLFRKCLTFSWEFMGARPIHHFQQERHHEILAQFAEIVDNGAIKSWVGTTYDSVTLENMRAAHILQQSGTAIGKIAVEAKFV
jgi:NADPH2:quinone reductase